MRATEHMILHSHITHTHYTYGIYFEIMFNPLWNMGLRVQIYKKIKDENIE